MELHPKAIRFALTFFPIGLVCALCLSLSNINTLQQAGMEMSPWPLILPSIVQIGIIYSMVLAYILSERIHLYKKGLHYAMVPHSSTHLFNRVILYLLIL